MASNFRARGGWLALAVVSLWAGAAEAEASWHEVTAGSVNFRYRWAGEILIGQVSAPTQGWMAIGLNDRPGLNGTHFLMLAPAPDAPSGVRLEEHVARPPQHAAVTTTAIPLDTWHEGNRRVVVFAWARPNPLEGCRSSTPGAKASAEPRRQHLMLAFSTHPEFDHHSRERHHVNSPLCRRAPSPVDTRRTPSAPGATAATPALQRALDAYVSGHEVTIRLSASLGDELVVDDLRRSGRQPMDRATFLARATSSPSTGAKVRTHFELRHGNIALASAEVSFPTRTVRDILILRRRGDRWLITQKLYRVRKNGDSRSPSTSP